MVWSIQWPDWSVPCQLCPAQSVDFGLVFFFIAAVERNDWVRLTKLDSRYDLTQSARVQIQTDDSLLYIHLNWILFQQNLIAFTVDDDMIACISEPLYSGRAS